MPLMSQYMSFFVSCSNDSLASLELNNFLKAHRIINIDKTFIDNKNQCGWAFLIEYTDAGQNKVNGMSFSSKVDYRDILTETEFALYDMLRKTRKQIGEKTKIPLYAIFSNEQLALMAQNPPENTDGLLRIKGVTEGKVKQYGQEFLSVIKNTLLNTEKSVENENQDVINDIF